MAAQAKRMTRGDDTRARLFAAAVRLFAEHGYADTTVDKIVRKAGVAKGTFFIHFATKDAVVTELVRNQIRIARNARDLALAQGRSPVEALRTVVMTLGEHAAANRHLSRAVISANILNPTLGGFAESVFGGITSEMKDDVRAAQRLGLLDPSFDAETIAETLIMAYLGAALHFATAPGSKALLTLLAPVVEANLAGFGAARATKLAKATKVARKRAKKRAG